MSQEANALPNSKDNGTLKKNLTKKKINVVMVGGLRQTQKEQCSPNETSGD